MLLQRIRYNCMSSSWLKPFTFSTCGILFQFYVTCRSLWWTSLLLLSVNSSEMPRTKLYSECSIFFSFVLSKGISKPYCSLIIIFYFILLQNSGFYQPTSLSVLLWSWQEWLKATTRFSILFGLTLLIFNLHEKYSQSQLCGFCLW